MSSQQDALYFSIEGEFITNHFRNLLLEGSWEQAINGLRASLISSNEEGKTINYPYEDAIRMLMGKEKLVGVDHEMELLLDDQEDVIMKQMDFFYSNLVKINSVWYKPYAYVNTCIKNSDMATERALIYSNNPFSDKVLFIDFNGVFYAVLFEISKYNPPLWLIEKYSNNISNFSIKDLEERGFELNQNFSEIINYQKLDVYSEFVQLEIEYREQLEDNILFKQLQSKIIEQAKLKGGFFEIILSDKRKFIVPKAPFINWSLRDNRFSYNRMNWEIVSPKGLKMMGDNPEHTDWVIGMGINPNDFYSDETLVEHMCNLSFSIFKNSKKEDFIKISGKGIFSGNVVFIKDKNQQVKPGSIIVIPNASIDYLNVISNLENGCVITLIGGPAAHLCVNANELNLNMILKPDLNISENDYVLIDLDKGTFYVK